MYPVLWPDMNTIMRLLYQGTHTAIFHPSSDDEDDKDGEDTEEANDPKNHVFLPSLSGRIFEANYSYAIVANINTQGKKKEKNFF